MPLIKHYRDRLIRNTKRININGKTMIRITFEGTKGMPGDQMTVTEDEFVKGRKVEMVSKVEKG